MARVTNLMMHAPVFIRGSFAGSPVGARCRLEAISAYPRRVPRCVLLRHNGTAIAGHRHLFSFAKRELTADNKREMTAIGIAFGACIAAAIISIPWAMDRLKQKDLHQHRRSAPCSIDTSTGQAVATRNFSFEHAEATLRREQQQIEFYSGRTGRGSVHVVRVASNAPVEDNWAVSAWRNRPTVDHASTPKFPFFGVFDGHAGSTTSNLLADRLITWVSASFWTEPAGQSTGAVNKRIQDCFLDFDKSILDAASQALDASTGDADCAVMDKLAPVLAGSCALLASFDWENNILRVANTGDSRAVLGQFNRASGKYEMTAMSEDHSGRSKSEIARLIEEHPDEPHMSDGLHKTGRILGLACTRAFGDHRWKYDEETIKRISRGYFGYPPRPHTKTPPYVTARPDVRDEKILRGQKNKEQMNRPSFAILASDGLWDYISSRDAVECVERWIDEMSTREGYAQEQKPDPPAASKDENAEGKGKLFSFLEGKYTYWRYKPGWFTCQDDNAAAHLVRNAFGGKHETFFTGIMSSRPPLARNIRDDVTVQVIFFDEAPNVRR